MTPYEIVKQHYELPFELYPFQQHSVNELAELRASGLYHSPGLGKTVTSFVTALFKRVQNPKTKILVLMPPILLSNWRKNVGYFNHKTQGALKCLVYAGTPVQRKAMDISTPDVVLMSLPIFKKDYNRILRELGHHHVHVINDEAHSIKNVSTGNYKDFREFTMEQSFQLLTGTPLTASPMDAYAYIKLVSPYAYATKNQFAARHIAELDYFGNPTKWINLDLMEENLMKNADRKTKEEVLLDLPPCTVDFINYDLAPKHLNLYRKLAEEEMLKYDDGSKLDATSVQALWHALQQIVVNYEHFSGEEDPADVAPLDLIEQVLDEIAPRKLLVFSHYKLTNRLLKRKFEKKYNAAGIWGELTPKQKQSELNKFIEDPTCRLGYFQATSAGLGLDGCQAVCSDVLYIEVPITPSQFDQSRSRVYRDGQKLPVTCRVAVANGTLQVRSAKALAEKQTLVNSVQGGLTDLRDALMGR